MFAIELGDSVEIDGRVYAYTHRTLSGKLCFRDRAEGNTAELSQDELLEKFTKREVKLRVINPDDTSADFRRLDLASVPDAHRKEAEERVGYINAIYAAKTPRPFAKTWPNIISAVAALNGTDAPEWTTVRRWMRSYEGNNCDIRSLLPSYGRRGCNEEFRPTEERQFLNELILDLYLVKSRPTIKWLHKQIGAKYREIQQTRPDACLWKIPSLSWVYRRIKKIDAYDVDRARFGKRIADHKFRAIGRGRPATYRLEVVEIDHTTANIMIVDDTTRIALGRPTITIAIDRFTRMIVGLYIGFEPPSTYSIMQCLRNMIAPKTYVATEFPKINVPWKAHGIPTSVVVDNAFEFTSDSFREAAAVFKFDIFQQPVRQPEFKGIVERFMRTIEQMGMSGLPGRTFSNPKERAEYDSANLARLTLHEFREHFHFWLLADYCYRMHDGILDVPARRWDEEVARLPVELPMSMEEIDVHLGITKQGTLRREGIRYANLFFNSPELNAVFRQLGPRQIVKFKVNQNDLSEIIVIHPTKNVPIRAYCTYREYSAGLTLHQHRIIRALRKKQCADFTDQNALVAARDAFLQASADLLMRSNTRRRSRLARHQGGENVHQPATPPDIEEFKRMVFEPTSFSEFEDILAADTAAEVQDEPAEIHDAPTEIHDEPSEIQSESAPAAAGNGSHPTPATPSTKASIPLLRYRDRDGGISGDDQSSI